MVVYTYLVTKVGYFRLVTTVALVMSITDGKLQLCHGFSEGILDKKFSTR